jgi:hydrogenase expression/formation protein HypC
MRIDSIAEFTAQCSAKGEAREVSLWLLQWEDLAVGDHVMVHLGQATQKMSAEDATATWALLDEVVALSEAATEALMPLVEKG